MQRTPVTSSNIRSIGYDASTATLEVEFNDFSIYRYSGVPAQLHESLMNSASKGRFLANFIKNRFTHTQIK
ncbi:hypothetical protein MFUL124B02_40065 [Myxococcus fulvus 124B02]|nr:hypothetical protein MFUL124B02_40065 [Myxococcus fulvus 124B02]